MPVGGKLPEIDQDTAVCPHEDSGLEVREALEPTAERTGQSVDEVFEQLAKRDRLERVRQEVATRQALELVVREAKPISVEQAKARDKLWTPGKESPESGQLWTPGS